MLDQEKDLHSLKYSKDDPSIYGFELFPKDKFVNEGDKIKSGQILLIIEAMKTMNPIESTLQGKLIKVLIENEQAVEFGQPLMLIE